ncbi:MAG: cytochrome b/b6 domain-containing protein [Deltaproteobacteria bacterium]|nr:cytochrome b/b6 domain-containing protein [Deltaproteobacteria bacterium]
MAGNEDRERVMVDAWDWPTRALHWINAALVVTLALLMLGKDGMELLGVEKALRRPLNFAHAYVGFAFIATFSLRVIWAFVGNRYARWADIIPISREQREGIARDIKWYLSGFKGSPTRVAGHDPLASLFYIVLFVVLASQAATGLVLSGAELKVGPLSGLFSGMGEEAIKNITEALEEVHEAGFLYILFFIFAHIVGLVVHEVSEKTGLFSSMIHGKKYFPKDRP